MKLFDNIIIVLAYALPAALMLWAVIQVAVLFTN
jgi:hypothetical protein